LLAVGAAVAREGERRRRWVPWHKRRGEVVGPTCHGGMRAAMLGERSGRGCPAAAAVGWAAAAVVGHRARARASESRMGG
jgi:hypothetical protein